MSDKLPDLEMKYFVLKLVDSYDWNRLLAELTDRQNAGLLSGKQLAQILLLCRSD